MEEDEEKSDDSADYYGSIVTDTYKRTWNEYKKSSFDSTIDYLEDCDYRSGCAGDFPAWQHGVFLWTFRISGRGCGSRLLEKKGLVEDWKLFYIQVLCSKYSKTMKPGTYTLSTAMKPRQLMAVLSGEDVEFDWGQEEES